MESRFNQLVANFTFYVLQTPPGQFPTGLSLYDGQGNEGPGNWPRPGIPGSLPGFFSDPGAPGSHLTRIQS